MKTISKPNPAGKQVEATSRKVADPGDLLATLDAENRIGELVVFYDGECGICRRVRGWFGRQVKVVNLRFLALQTPGIEEEFPVMAGVDLRKELVVVSDAGEIYQGSAAWIMCLYALRDYRTWAYRLAHPTLRPLAQRVCEMVSENRLGISRWFLKDRLGEVQGVIAAEPVRRCDGGTCRAD